ncbi:MAG TPA: GvpL/GvpF family gas vesicle protein [Gaiellaceae bacterium]|nr:GvpL/GvpF family gas vesicle protein [Gaiellaceae bacterium]
MSAYDDVARILAERNLDVGDLIRQAEEDARAEVAETLRRLFADDLLRRVGERLGGGTPVVALAGVADGLRPLVLELAPGDLDDEGRLERLVREHNELLIGALEAGAVVPFRFGTTFPDRPALDAWLERHADALSAELERLRGTAEWSVEPVGSVPEVDAAEYLGARLATTVRPGLRERLAAVSEDAAGDAYLVSRARQEEFGAAVAGLEAEGYELRVTGPWPPYSFARLP